MATKPQGHVTRSPQGGRDRAHAVIGVKHPVYSPGSNTQPIVRIPDLVFWSEKLFNRLPEYLGEFECQRQTRVIFTGLDRVDGLARYSQLGRKDSLGQGALAPEVSKSVFHW